MLKPPDANADLKLRFSIDRDRSLRNVENVNWTWGELVERLSRSYKDPLTLKQFKELSKDKQSTRKNNGYFIGAAFGKSIRNKALMKERTLITFDIDEGNPEILGALRRGETGLGKVEYVVYSTRTHGGDKIKLRVVFPLAKPLSVDLFQPLSHIMAWNIDFNMVAVDNVSYHDTQIMYWPAHCADIEPIFFHRKGRLIDPLAIMEDYLPNGAWKDLSLLPKSPREGDLRASGTTKPDPRLKRGIVGAMCREYTVDDAVQTFLSDKYTASEYGPNGVPSRYTFLEGTTHNGVVVFDDGHIQSYHGSDPAGGLNLNVFDWVRIHKFGHLDGTKDLDADPRTHPSYKAMEQFLLDDSQVMADLRDSNYGLSEEDVDASFDVADPAAPQEVTSEEIPDSVFEIPDASDWRDRLDTNEKGTIKANVANVVLILRHHPLFAGRFGYNEFTGFNVLIRRLRVRSLNVDYPLTLGPERTLLEEHHYVAVRLILASKRGPKLTGWGMNVSVQDVRAAVMTLCRENSFHPVRDHLESLRWDGVSRVEQLWIRGCHTGDTPYHRATARNFLLAAVARIVEPGTKFDFMPVLVGPTGVRKTTFVTVMGYTKWYGESPGHFDDKKKFVEATHGVWILEFGEMTNFRRASDDEAIKAMLSGTVDLVRLSYRTDPTPIPRQFVMVGTTEHKEFLRDFHRRIWPIVCGDGPLDLDWLAENRDQLYAEALHIYNRMGRDAATGTLALDIRGEALAEFVAGQSAHMLPDDAVADAGIVRAWLDTPVEPGKERPGFSDRSDAEWLDDDLNRKTDTLIFRTRTCALEVWDLALRRADKYDRTRAQTVGRIMRVLEPEWRVGTPQLCGKYGNQRVYIRTGKPPENDL